MDSVRMQSMSTRPPDHLTTPSPPAQPTNDDIEAVIQMATSARPSPDGRTVPLRDTRTQLFVGNLPYRVRWQDLKDLFRRAGTVLRADVSLGPDNRSRGYGTVLLATAEDAGRAIDMFNGFSWQTRILEVRPDRLPPDFDNPAGNLPPPPAHNLSTSVQGGSLPTPYSLATNASGSGLPLTSVSDDLDYTSLYGHDLAPTANNNLPCRNLFVGNLPFHCQWQDLKDLFRQAGTIIRADVALGADGRSRGFGTVVFANEHDADRAVRIFNGYEYNGRVLKVHYDKFSQTGQPATTPASPAQNSFSTANLSLSSAASPALSHATAFGSSHPSHITLPLGYHIDFGPPSGPTTPHELYTSSFSFPLQQQPQSQSQQLQQRPQPQQSQSGLHSAQMSFPLSQQSRLFSGTSSRVDIDSLADSFAASKISNLTSVPQPSSSITSPIRASALSSSTSSTSSASASSAASPSRSQAKSHSPPQSLSQSLPQSPRPQQQRQQHARHPSQRQQQQQSHHLSHPHHPGPITLPPPPQVPFPVSPTTPVHPGIGMSLSPSHYPGMGSSVYLASYQPSHPNVVPITPHGLPPITPSMPPFTFLPPPVSPMHHPSQAGATPTHFGSSNQLYMLAAMPSPGLSQPSSPLHPHPHILGAFSPGVAMSPGAFWGRPGSDHPNPAINPAVGAPVHVNSGGYFYPMSSSHQGPKGNEPKEYFDPAYFPPMVAHSLGPSGLANEILKDHNRKGEKDDKNLKEDSSPSEDATEGGMTRCGSASTATSWTPSEKGEKKTEDDIHCIGEKDSPLIPRSHSLLNTARPAALPQTNRSESDPTLSNSTSSNPSSTTRSPAPWQSPLESPSLVAR